MAKASTIITTNYNALLRAADNIAAKNGKISKNAVINSLASAIAGKGKDAGFLKNAPGGVFVQPGIEMPSPQQEVPQTSVYVVVMDERDDWAREPDVYTSRDELTQGLRETYHFLFNQGEKSLDKAIEATIANGGASWPEDEADYDVADNPYSLTIYEYKIQAPSHKDGVWALEIDNSDAWGSKTRLFSSQKAALAAFSAQRNFYSHEKHVFFDEILRTLAETGVFDSTPQEDFDEDIEDEDAYFDRVDSAFQVSIRRIEIENLEATPVAKAPDLPQEGSKEDLACPYLYHPDEDSSSGNDEGLFFADQAKADAYAAKHCPNEDERAKWMSKLTLARDCQITARFRPEVWINDYATTVDAQGDTEWMIAAHELFPNSADNDYLKGSHLAPEWVREWSGPFEIYISVELP